MLLARCAALALLLTGAGQVAAQAPHPGSASGMPDPAAASTSAGASAGAPVLSGIDFLQARTWTSLLALKVGDRPERDRRAIPDNRRFVSVSVCALKDTIRIRDARVQFGDGRWQRLVVPPTLAQGECSKGTDLVSAPRRLRAVQFDYQTVSAGRHRGELLVRGRLAR